MQTETASSAAMTAPPMGAPIAPMERIEALDVVRGFALIGIFLMNIEFFNRATNGIGLGMPVGLTGMDWLASWFIAYFVQGKFWTIFSLLFGMGFAVMLTRAERAGREFMQPYLRRILALAVFGAAHYIFLWNGDILFSYAVGAGALLILLYGHWKPILIAMAALVGIGFIPGMDPAFGIAGSLGFVLAISLYLRNERSVTIRGRVVPVFGLMLLSLGTLALIAAIVLWALPNGPKPPRVPTSVFAVVLLIVGYLAAKYHNPPSLRPLRLSVAVYTFSFSMMTIFGLLQYLKPHEPEAPTPVAAVATAPAQSAAATVAPPGSVPVLAISANKVATAVDKDAKPSEAEIVAKEKEKKAKRMAEREIEVRNEVRVLSSGTYLEAVELRARKFPQKLAEDSGFATILLAMFLLGSWFVRSGIMENTQAHLPLFRKLALYALPIGIGMGLLGSMVTMSHIPGDETDGFQFARGLAMLGNLPACLGYVGLVVVMLHSNTVWSGIRVLAPAGRMALTTYLTQSLICSLVFFGYGLGYWGLGRAWQVVFVAVVFSLQVAFSHWWLARFRFGPLEWLWRAFTYRQMPAMRVTPLANAKPGHGVIA